MSHGVPTSEARVVETDASALDSRLQRRLVLYVALTLVVLTGILVLLEHTVLTPPAPGSKLRSSYATSADGYRGAFAVATALGYRTERFRGSYARLPEPPAEHTLLLLDPLPAGEGGFRFDPAQARALRGWTGRGGHVVCAWPGMTRAYWLGVALPEGVSPARTRDIDEPDPITTLLGTPPARVRAPAAGAVLWADGTPLRRPLATPAALARPLAAFLHPPPGLDRVTAVPEADVFAAGLERPFESVVLLGDAPWVVRCAVDQGAVWSVASGLPLCNYALGRMDTAPLLAGVLRDATDGGRRAVWFDEYCHGLRPDPGYWHWLTDSDLRYPAIALVLVVILWSLRSSVRVGPPRPERVLPRRAKEEFVLALADLMERAGRYRAAAEHLLHHHEHARVGPGAKAAVHKFQELRDAVARAPEFGARDLQTLERRARALHDQPHSP